ncbi:glutathione S-transferase family protein [Halobacteriovorax sp. JY17]|uniref:glutathione S-transferase family protein n=1 Tax=Halobacteriovorax sp. JY17 TaxID=2014617 RepID=UPI000C5F8886|nr:glutathione S-transferase family protein [Halobacteriovorax sp. JY17]PIK15216.1 MAG: glutathione S-transferase [Halobacteriovorax sp. JY17]
MLKFYGFNSQNNKKVIYVAEELNLSYDFQLVNLMERENRTEEFLKMNPVGKVPVLEHDGKYLFESGAICRYLADISDSPLLPSDKFERAQVDQWMEFFTNHLGRWLNSLFFERILKNFLGLGEANQTICEEAEKFSSIQLKIVEKELSKRKYIASDNLSIADLFAYAYVEQMDPLEMSFDQFPNTLKWKNEISKRDSIARAQKNFK